MLKRPLLLIFLAIILSACAKKQMTVPVTVKNNEQTRLFSSFNQVDVGGHLDVRLRTGYAKPRVLLHGDPRDLIQVRTIVKDNVLKIILNTGFPRYGAVTAEVRGQHLNAFSYSGVGHITGKNIHSELFDLYLINPGKTVLGGSINLRNLVIKGPGDVQISGIKSRNLILSMSGKAHVQLAGVANVSKINLQGEGWFGLYWVKSDSLTINARGHAFLQLGGIANRLEVELWEHARFNGRYLRSIRTFIKTHDHSVAEISTLDRQHTFAMDASDIQFFNIPKTKADFMAENGSVLDMRDLSPPDIEEYTMYNK